MIRPASICLVAIVCLAAAPAAFAGGTIRAFALLPASGRIAAVDIERHHIARLIAVPAGDGPIAASGDGSRVLVANTARGIVSEVSGLSGRHVRTFHGLGHPVALQMLPNSTTSSGYVQPRYTVVADARGQIVVLDLKRGRIAARLPVAAPVALALDGDDLWVASSASTRLTLVLVADPARPRVIDHVDARIQAIALAVDTAVAAGVDAVSRDGRFEQIDGVTLAQSSITRVGGPVTVAFAGYQGDVWVATGDGEVHGVDAASGHATGLMRLPRNGALTMALGGGEVLIARGDLLATYWLGQDHQPWRATVLPGRARGIAYAMLP
jgi:DNA-binding beta-propeller fold protein YncE